MERRSDSQADTGPDPPDDQARRDLPFNFRVLLVHGMFGQTGFRLVNAPTFLPAFVAELAGSNFAVGMARAIQSLGMFLSPVLAARTVEHRERVKVFALIYGSGMRVGILSLALIAIFVPTEYALGLVWLTLGLFGFALGMQGVVFNYLGSKTIPVDRRGRLMGLRNATAGVISFGVAGVGGFLVDRYGFPAGYGYTFLAAFVLTSLGLLVFALLREPPALETRPATPVLTRIADIPVLIRNEPEFGSFLVARILAFAARGALPFYVIFVGTRFGLSGARLAVLTIAFTLAQSVSALAWGLLADRVGFRIGFISGLLTWIAGTALLAFDRIEAMYVVFVLVGTGLGGFMLSSQNMVLEFGSALDRPLRIATANSISELAGMFGFLTFGLVADLAPLWVVFATATVLQLCSVAVMRVVTEPRVPVEPSVPLTD